MEREREGESVGRGIFPLCVCLAPFRTCLCFCLCLRLRHFASSMQFLVEWSDDFSSTWVWQVLVRFNSQATWKCFCGDCNRQVDWAKTELHLYFFYLHNHNSQTHTQTVCNDYLFSIQVCTLNMRCAASTLSMLIKCSIRVPALLLYVCLCVRLNQSGHSVRVKQHLCMCICVHVLCLIEIA